MSDKFFIDTNIFIYAWDSSDLVKKQKAVDIIQLATADRAGVVSYQVVQEFLNAALKKAVQKISIEDARQSLETVFRPLLSVHSSIALFQDAIVIQSRYRLSWYDSLIVAAAQRSNCKLLYTENLRHGQQFGDLQVQNPFQ
jgi:predicted nucleic acid-binding protein